jgi:hypothetical protein
MLTKEAFIDQCIASDRREATEKRQEISDLVAIWQGGKRPRRDWNPDGLMSDEDWYIEMARAANAARYLEMRLEKGRDFETAYRVYLLYQETPGDEAQKSLP